MATNNGLEIKVGADVQGAVTGINTLNKSLATLPKASGQATTSLTNFSRVVQDAPFGIIGVANNIDPLIQSFIGLRKETGSAKAAFAALGSSLIGGGGLALAISLVTSGLVLFAQSQQKANKEVKDATKDTDSYVRKLTEQKIEVASLVKLVKDESQAQETRTRALQKLNDIIPDTIGKLTQQNIATAQGANIIRQYVKAIEAQATAELLIGRIAENNIKLFDNRNAALKAQVDFEQQINDLRIKQEQQRARNQFELAEQTGLQIKTLIRLNAESQKNNNQFRKTATDILDANDKLRAEYERILPTQIQLEKIGKEKVKDVKEETKAVRENLNTRAELNGALERSLQLIIANKEAEAAFAKEVLRNAPKQKPGSQLDFILSGSGDNSTQLEALQGVQDKLIDISGTIENGLNAGIDTFFNAIANNQDPFKALAQSAGRLVTELAAAVVKALVLQAISAAISGGGSIGANRAFGAAGGGLLKGKVRGADLQLLTFLRG